MSTRIQTLVVLRALVLSVSMSGCLSATTAKPEGGAAIVVDPKGSMLASLEGHARRTIGAVNSVVLTGEFMKALKLTHPPEAIPVDVTRDLHRGMDFLLGSPVAEDVTGKRFLYTPDARFCRELAAKENPGTCLEVLSHVRFEQIMISDDQGTVQAQFDNLRPFYLSYGPTSVEVSVSVHDVVAMAWQIDLIRQAHGEIQQPNGPSLSEGIVRATLVENSASSETITLSIDSRLRVGGTNSDQTTYEIDVPVVSNALSLTFDTAVSQGRLIAQVPSFELEFPVNGSDQSMHQMQVHFPGVFGEIFLDNTTRRLAARSVVLALQGLKIDVDGSPALEAHASKALSAHITPDADGKIMPCFDQDFAFTADIPGFAGVIEPHSPIGFSAQAGTCQSLN